MKLKVGDEDFFLDEEVFITSIKTLIANKTPKKVTLKNGSSIDLSETGVISTVVRQLTSMLCIPILQHAFAIMGLEMPKKKKHSNSMKYCLDCFCLLAIQCVKGSTVEINYIPYKGDGKQIVSAQIQLANSLDIHTSDHITTEK